MQLPAAAELVLLSGRPPIRAKKLRYFEDRRFRTRIAPPPELAVETFADRPASRPDDWADLRTAPEALSMADEDEAVFCGDGGLRHERHPGPQADELHPLVAVPADALGLGVEDDEFRGAPLLARMRTLAPALAADAINQGSDRGGDPIPSF